MTEQKENATARCAKADTCEVIKCPHNQEHKWKAANCCASGFCLAIEQEVECKINHKKEDA